MTCNCNDNCNCNEEIQNKYLDEAGLLYYTQLLKLVLDEKYQFLQSISANGDTITFKFSDGSTQKVKLDEGSATAKGMVRLSDSITDEANGVNSGVAATPKAVNAVHKEVKAIKDSPASLLTGLSIAELKKFAQAIIESGGGLGVDSDGKIFVDFETMPTDKFDKLMKDLGVPIQVKYDGTGATDDLDGKRRYGDWYVNPEHDNASDDTNDIVVGTKKYGRGMSKTYPFKTIQKCVDYVTQNFNIGKHTVVINIKGGEYNTNLTLPDYTRTSGRIRLVPYVKSDNTEEKVTIRPRAAIRDEDGNITGYKTGVISGSAISCTGGRWVLARINTTMTTIEQRTAAGKAEGRNIWASSGANLTVLQGKHIFNGQEEVSNKLVNSVIGCSDNGTILHLYGPKIEAHKGRDPLTCIVARYSATIDLNSGNENDTSDSGKYYTIEATGTASTFIRAAYSSAINYVSGQTKVPHFEGDLTAKRYEVTNGSQISLNSSFWTSAPNLTEGSSESETFCFYRLGNSILD